MAFSPRAAKMAWHQASSLTVFVEYIKASVDRSSSWKPKTNISGSSGSSVATRRGVSSPPCSSCDFDGRDTEQDSVAINQVWALLIDQCLLQSNGFLKIPLTDNGDIFCNGGNESEVVAFPWSQADRSCEGIFPFTLKVPIRKLWYFCYKPKIDNESAAHVNLVRPFLDISRVLVRIHSSLSSWTSVWSSSVSPAHAGERRSMNGWFTSRKSWIKDVTVNLSQCIFRCICFITQGGTYG